MTAALALNCSQTLDIVVYQKRLITVHSLSAKDMPIDFAGSGYHIKAIKKTKRAHNKLFYIDKI